MRIAAAKEVLQIAGLKQRMNHLKVLCLAHGIWTVPENPDDYSPVWFEVSLFGVSAQAADPAQLPYNWCLAARRVLDAHSNVEAV